MKEYELAGKELRLFLKDDVLVLISEAEMTSVSSAVYNGGLKRAKAILNVHVSDSYNQKLLHEHPEQIILETAQKFGLNPQLSIGMITAADVDKFSIKTANKDGLTVSTIVTAGCSLAETAGEDIDVSPIVSGTINTIVVIDGNPSESCLLQTFITATEAKIASLRELDVRSTYTGDLATGTITDGLTIVSTKKGPEIRYGGPASKLGKLVGYCTREAVKDAILKNSNLNPTRSILKRFFERKLPIEKLVWEISKANHVKMSLEEITSRTTKTLKEKPLFALVLMMAASVDEEIKRGLVPEEFGDINALSEEFKKNFFKVICMGEKFHHFEKVSSANLGSYPFLKSVLSCIIEENFSKNSP
jgi:adenosylcobinamide amidohydrolase